MWETPSCSGLRGSDGRAQLQYWRYNSLLYQTFLSPSEDQVGCVFRADPKQWSDLTLTCRGQRLVFNTTTIRHLRFPRLPLDMTRSVISHTCLAHTRVKRWQTRNVSEQIHPPALFFSQCFAFLYYLHMVKTHKHPPSHHLVWYRSSSPPLLTCNLLQTVRSRFNPSCQLLWPEPWG